MLQPAPAPQGGITPRPRPSRSVGGTRRRGDSGAPSSRQHCAELTSAESCAHHAAPKKSHLPRPFTEGGEAGGIDRRGKFSSTRAQLRWRSRMSPSSLRERTTEGKPVKTAPDGRHAGGGPSPRDTHWAEGSPTRRGRADRGPRGAPAEGTGGQTKPAPGRVRSWGRTEQGDAAPRRGRAGWSRIRRPLEGWTT